MQPRLLPLVFALLAAPAAAAEPALEYELDGEPAQVLAAWQKAMTARGLQHRGHLDNLLVGDHPALPFSAEFQFSGAANIGVFTPEVNGSLAVERVGVGRSAVRLEYHEPIDPKDAKRLPKLSAKLQAEAAGFLLADDPGATPIHPDALLADPAACGERLEAFLASPIAGARQTLILTLPTLAEPCRRSAVRALVTDAHGKEAATAWLLELYEAADDAQKAALVPLVLAVPEPDDALYDIIEVEEEKAIQRLEAGE